MRHPDKAPKRGLRRQALYRKRRQTRRKRTAAPLMAHAPPEGRHNEVKALTGR